MSDNLKHVRVALELTNEQYNDLFDLLGTMGCRWVSQDIKAYEFNMEVYGDTNETEENTELTYKEDTYVVLRRVMAGQKYMIHPCQAYQGIEEGIVQVVDIVNGEDNFDIKDYISALLNQLDCNEDNKALATDMWEGMWVEYKYVDRPNDGSAYLLVDEFIDHCTNL